MHPCQLHQQSLGEHLHAYTIGSYECSASSPCWWLYLLAVQSRRELQMSTIKKEALLAIDKGLRLDSKRLQGTARSLRMLGAMQQITSYFPIYLHPDTTRVPTRMRTYVRIFWTDPNPEGVQTRWQGCSGVRRTGSALSHLCRNIL
jgi:hypothetical protein